ncbi:hypothetical protein LCGC14_2283940 [marine sediment metagenome]|uniref:Homing endonuclease LAGLIDADG domain-containing protein n=1 Tax=marine sediment metagenome TaxID=412755 RepID=A0A0F9DFQ2_9ZZZZ
MKITKQYMAGFVDGEGYLNVGRKKDIRIKRGYTLRYRLYLTNQHKGILEQIQLQYGGRIREKKNQYKCYDLMIDTKEPLRKILKDIIPFLIIKKSKAQEIYNILTERKDQKQGKRLSEELIKKF